MKSLRARIEKLEQLATEQLEQHSVEEVLPIEFLLHRYQDREVEVAALASGKRLVTDWFVTRGQFASCVRQRAAEHDQDHGSLICDDSGTDETVGCLLSGSELP